MLDFEFEFLGRSALAFWPVAEVGMGARMRYLQRAGFPVYLHGLLTGMDVEPVSGEEIEQEIARVQQRLTV